MLCGLAVRGACCRAICRRGAPSIAGLAENAFAPNTRRVMPPLRNPYRAQIGFLTDDYLVGLTPMQ